MTTYFDHTLEEYQQYDPRFSNVVKMTKRERRKIQKENQTKNQLKNLSPKNIRPITLNQQRAFDYFYKNKNVLLHGLAGTGKTFISLYLALDEILNSDSTKEKVTIVRSVVPTRDMGFLPGDNVEKAKVYEQPYVSIINELFYPKKDVYDFLKKQDIIEFVTTSFIRGLTLQDTIVVVDECQNMSYHELDSVITRLGENCKVLFCGDFRQSDLCKQSEKEGLLLFMKVLNSMKSFSCVEFNKEDIVRSELVKEYILSKLEQGII